MSGTAVVALIRVSLEGWRIPPGLSATFPEMDQLTMPARFRSCHLGRMQFVACRRGSVQSFERRHGRGETETQSGTGTVRMWPPFPIRSTIAQCSSRLCKWSTVSSVISCRRRPHARRIASSARSRYARRRTAPRRKVDGTWCELSRFQVQSIPNHDSPAER